MSRDVATIDDEVETFERLESEVRGYCRSWPVLFDRARGSEVFDVEGKRYLDFFSGAGALNYGHNHKLIKAALIRYLADDRVIHSLDMYTVAKQEFLRRFEDVVLEPKGLEYRIQFPGPTGTNSVESALKLARKVTGRDDVVSFTNAFHGMTLGSLSVTGNSMKREGAGVPLGHSTTMPYCGYHGDLHTIEYFEALIADGGSGVELPAGVIVETVQAEGGINVASDVWLQRLAAMCKRYGMLLIVDDIQAGCGRTGPFFSFERAGITPDIVCLSKSLSGMGLPLAVTLIRPELDVWEPGEHNGTFRGNNPAFVTATAALDLWENDQITRGVERNAAKMRSHLDGLAAKFPLAVSEVRGIGMIQGLYLPVSDLASEVCAAAFERGLLLETSGPDSEVVKLLPPLVIGEADLAEGLEILSQAVMSVAATHGLDSAPGTNDVAERSS